MKTTHIPGQAIMAVLGPTVLLVAFIALVIRKADGVRLPLLCVVGVGYAAPIATERYFMGNSVSSGSVASPALSWFLDADFGGSKFIFSGLARLVR